MLIASAIQFKPRFARGPADVMDNFRKLEPLIRQAQDFGTNFLVFPELCLTGYSFLNKDEASEVAELSDGPSYRKMRGVAQALQSYVTYGYVERDDIDGTLYNAATMLNPDGELIASVRKINLFGNDFTYARPGKMPPPIVKTELGLVSLVICRDLRDKIPKNIPRTASEDPPLFDGKKIDLVAGCTNWGRGAFPANTWMDFSSDNQCTLVISNRWGKEENGEFSQNFGHGGSCIIEPDWTIHKDGLLWNSDCVVTMAR